MENIKYDVFLSRKSEDAHMAKEIYDFLTEKGLKVFDSDISLKEIGNADFSKAIDNALVNSSHLIVVGNSIENISSPWVEAEWRFFLNRKLSGKVSGNLFTVTTNALKIEDLPERLQNFQVLVVENGRFEIVCDYVMPNLNRSDKKPHNDRPDKEKVNNEKTDHFIDAINLSQKQVEFETWRQNGIECLSRKEYEGAVYWFRKAAEHGYAKAQYNLAVMYDDGLGVRKNFRESVKWFEKAAEQGNADAQFSLAWMFDEGFGVGIDEIEALNLYRKSAEQGNSQAQHTLGQSYEFGFRKNIRKNITEAIYWYRKAADQNHTAAISSLARLNKFI